MKIKGIYSNLEKEMKIAKVHRVDLVKVLPFNQNTITKKLDGRNRIYFDEAVTIRDFLHSKTGKKFDLEYLFRKV